MNYQKILKQLRHNYPEILLLLIIIAIGAYFRLHKINEYLTFLGDEGRDVTIVRNMILDMKPVLIGPSTSISSSSGNIYLGPFYYYLMIPPLLIANYSPIGPAIMVAIISLMTIVLVWWYGRTWSHPITGLTAAVLYSISPTIITYSKSSWNPNIMPLFVLLLIWSLTQIWKQKKYPRWIITGISMGIAIQSHYLSLLLTPLIIIIWILGLFQLSKQNFIKSLANYIKQSLIGIGAFITILTPLIIYDINHHYMNIKSIFTIFTDLTHTQETKLNFEIINQTYQTLFNIINNLLTSNNHSLTKLIIVLIVFTTIIEIIKTIRQKTKSTYLILVAWLTIGAAGLSTLQQIPTHYYSFLYPAPFLITAYILFWLHKLLKPATKIITHKSIHTIATSTIILILMIPLIYVNLTNHPFKGSPNKQLPHTKQISELIIQHNNNQPYNLTLTTSGNYDAGYQYFLKLKEQPPVKMNPDQPNTITRQLFVICEKTNSDHTPEKICNPIDHPTDEIKWFGPAELKHQWTLPWGHKLYKLTPQINN